MSTSTTFGRRVMISYIVTLGGFHFHTFPKFRQFFSFLEDMLFFSGSYKAFSPGKVNYFSTHKFFFHAIFLRCSV